MAKKKYRIREIEVQEEKIDWKFVFEYGVIGTVVGFLGAYLIYLAFASSTGFLDFLAKLVCGLASWNMGLDKLTKFNQSDIKKKVWKTYRIIADW